MNEYEFVDLFAGVGGMDLAARDLGVPGVGIEWDADACATRRAAGLATLHGDTRSYAPDDFPSANVLLGEPPCRSFSLAGSGAGRNALDIVRDLVRRLAERQRIAGVLADLADDPSSDERTELVLEPLRWALAAVDSGRPYEAVVLTQVPTVLPVWQAMGGVLSAEGYSVACGVLRAEQFGVPQTRRRAVLIARRHDNAVLPKATHQAHGSSPAAVLNSSTLLPYVTMGSALNRPEPFRLISAYGAGGDPRARAQRSSREPAFVVTGKASRLRITNEDGAELPRLSHSEMGQLQTFPALHPWSGKCIPQQIGNAVPPLLAAHILRAALGLGTATINKPRKPSNGGQNASLSSEISAPMRRQHARDNGQELAVRRLLHDAGLRYRVSVPIRGMPRRRIDIAFSRVRVAVFIHGCFWHGCTEHGTQPKLNVEWWQAKLAKTMARDVETTDHLTAEGWTVLRFWEHESPEHVAKRVAACVAERRDGQTL